VIVALVVVVALQVTGDGSGGSAASDSTPTSTGSVPGTSTAPAPSEGATTPTTGFADREPSLPATPYDYAVALPAHVERTDLQFDTEPSDVPVTDDIATLGRVLFYDVNLSANRTVRCASCHVQIHSFTDPLVRSQGLFGVRTRRNSMPLANARFNPSGRYLWDEKAASLEDQVLMPFVDPLEMGLSGPELIGQVETQSYYRPLFENAYGDGQVTGERIASALAQFVRAMVSFGSRYDEGRAQVASPLDPFPNLTDVENDGKQLFFTSIDEGGGSCASCHVGEGQLSRPAGLANNGVDPPFGEVAPPDLGAFEVTGDVADVGRFRVPSLRNVEVTGPYMHDGRFASLEAVVEHYNSMIQPHENLSSELRDDAGDPVRLSFDEDQVAALVAFLHTLTDEEFLVDERFSEPFRAP
jgi:cytochrome c peroxidase